MKIHNLTLAGGLAWLAIVAGIAAGGWRVEASPTFLHTQGQDIVNESGEKILLRGVGLGNWMLPEGYMWKFGNGGDRPRKIEKIVSDLIGPEDARKFWTEFRKSYITQADIQRIGQLGFNSVRPALNSRLFLSETEPQVQLEEGFALLDNLVAWCKAQGIYVIFDMHGAPGGQTGQNIDDSANDQPELFQEPKFQDQLVELWKAIARRYQAEPAVAGYDLLNEPLPGRTGAAKAHKAQLEPLYKRITQAIRKIDAKHIIIVEGVDWANDWSVFSKPFDKNLIYQFHYYCWDNPAKLKSVQTYLDYRKRFNAPIWVGETGERDAGIYWATTEYFEANNIGWCFWPWKKIDAENSPYSIPRPEGWEAVARYSRGGAKPARDLAKKAFDELLVKVRLDHCAYYPSVVNAMLRRAPARIEAENFGHRGPGISYAVTNSLARSRFYRLDDAVSIMPQESQRPRSSQYIILSATEWTAYTISSEAPKLWDLTARVRAEESPAEVRLLVNGQPLDLKITEKGWVERKLGAVQFKRGANELKWMITRGTADLDWLGVELAEKQEEAGAN